MINSEAKLLHVRKAGIVRLHPSKCLITMLYVLAVEFSYFLSRY